MAHASSSDPSTVPPVPVDVTWVRRGQIEPPDWSIMSPLERTRVERRSPGVRERSAVARILLRLALAQRFDRAPESFDVDWSRGPSIADPAGTWLSLTHTGDLVAVCITSAGPIGLDLETLDRAGELDDTFRAGAFDDGERAMLAEADGRDGRDGRDGAAGRDGRAGGEAALRLWTAKEAVLKASGDGLTRSPLQLHVSGIPDRPWLARFDGRPELVGRTVLRPLTLPGYVGSVAVLTSVPVVLTVTDGTSLFPGS